MSIEEKTEELVVKIAQTVEEPLQELRYQINLLRVVNSELVHNNLSYAAESMVDGYDNFRIGQEPETGFWWSSTGIKFLVDGFIMFDFGADRDYEQPHCSSPDTIHRYLQQAGMIGKSNDVNEFEKSIKKITALLQYANEELPEFVDMIHAQTEQFQQCRQHNQEILSEYKISKQQRLEGLSVQLEKELDEALTAFV